VRPFYDSAEVACCRLASASNGTRRTECHLTYTAACGYHTDHMFIFRSTAPNVYLPSTVHDGQSCTRIMVELPHGQSYNPIIVCIKWILFKAGSPP
jgi:hypothetical protein